MKQLSKKYRFYTYLSDCEFAAYFECYAIKQTKLQNNDKKFSIATFSWTACKKTYTHLVQFMNKLLK